MTFTQVQDELNRIYGFYGDSILSRSYAVDQENETISWHGYRPGIFKNLYAKEYETLLRGRQYSFLLTEDKGFLQFYFDYHQGDLVKAKLAYYPYPARLREIDDDVEVYMDDSNDAIIEEYYYDLWQILSHHFNLTVSNNLVNSLIREARGNGNFENEDSMMYKLFEEKYLLTNSSHVRIDYDNGVTTHNKCEMQIGAINEMRIPISKVVSPFVFFSWVIKNIQRDYYLDRFQDPQFAPFYSMSNGIIFDTPDFNEDNLYLIL